MLIKNTPLISVKAGPDDGLAEGQFIVYPSTFTKTPDSYGDIVAPGAFSKTLQDWQDSGNVMPGLYGHRMDDPDFYVASADEMGEDDHGWWVKGTFDLESPKGNQVYRLVKGRRLNQLSFAYDVQQQEEVELEDGAKANELQELQVYEFSFVPVGANQDTSVVAIKGFDLVPTGTTIRDIRQAASAAAALKEGRVISAKNMTSLRTAWDALGEVIHSVEGSDEGKASTAAPLKVEDPESGKTEEAAHAMTVRAQALIHLTSSL
jgi:HK97 family phage prohead protease